MKWILLNKYSEDKVWRGAVFRCNGKYPYEETVDFMVFDHPDSPSGFSLLVSSGQKAGEILLQFPIEALHKGSDIKALSTKWIIKNWNDWVYPDNTKEVKIINHYSFELRV